MQVSIITPLFNRLDLTLACLESLRRTLRGWRYEVILIDDGSTDGTREFLHTLRDPRFRVILNAGPLGFAANNNLGARLARAPLLCLLNNDTVLTPGWLAPLAWLAHRLPDAACVGNVQREPASGLIDHFGVYFDHAGVPLHAGKNAFVAPAEPYLAWPAVTAACCVVRRRVFLRLGGFDERFRNGLEDVDFCLRAGRQGYRHFVANRSVIYHHVSASPGRKVHDHANFALFQGRWLDFLTGEARRRVTVADERRAGWRYLRQHGWRPWRYNLWRCRRALAALAASAPPSRRPDVPPFPAGGWLGNLRRSAPGAFLAPPPSASPTLPAPVSPPVSRFLVVGDTAQTASHSGVPTVVRCLANALGRLAAPVRLVAWRDAARNLCPLPPEFSVGLDADALRPADPAPLARSAPSLYDPSAAAPDDLFARPPALHELPPGSLPPPGSWIVLPEVLSGGRAARLVDYVHAHGWRLAVILHDALPTNEPHLFPPDVPNEHAGYLRACSRADLLLPVSDFTAHDWRLFTTAKGLPSGPVAVCKLAADGTARTRGTASSPRDSTAPVTRLLCVSAVEPRKNHRALLAAYELALAAQPALRLELCLVGAPRPNSGAVAADIHAAMARHPGKLAWYEWVDYSALRRLYETCDFTVYPSILEGFGLPIIESLWFRRPCICANFGAMDELAYGGGCLVTDVRDPPALAAAILSLATPETLEKLAAQIDARGLRSWEEYARDVLNNLSPSDRYSGFQNA